MSQAIFGAVARFDHLDLNHPVSVIELAKWLTHLILGSKDTKALDFANRHGRGGLSQFAQNTSQKNAAVPVQQNIGIDHRQPSHLSDYRRTTMILGHAGVVGHL